MDIHYGTISTLDEPHIVMTHRHVARMRQSLREDLIRARDAGEVPNADFIRGLQNMINGIEAVLLEERPR